MKNLKLILKSLVSNNACIDGGRHRPWYFAVIMLILSMVLGLLPMFVQTWNTNGDDAFKTYSYGADQATYSLNNYLNDNEIKMYVKTSPLGEKFISSEDKDGKTVEFTYEHKIPVQREAGKEAEEVIDYIFYYRTSYNQEEFTAMADDGKTSFMVFYSDMIYMNVVNFNTQTAIKQLTFQKAAKEFDDGFTINSLLSTSTDATTRLNDTWTNWKGFIRKAYNTTRLTSVWQSLVIMGAIDLGIILFMGLMIWILTRGKNNPYRLFKIWECQKISWWVTITPAILTLALGFLITSFANVLFPMLMGIRTMWLSMKSLRPDGSGYADN